MPRYHVIRDTREQENNGWVFDETKNCEGMLVQTLPTGDYTLKEYESTLIIERKGGVAEFARNIIQGRFEAELVRMESFAFPFMVLEFNMKEILEFPNGSGIPREKWPSLKITPFFMLKRLIEFELNYKTKIILAGSYGKETAASIFKRVIELCPNQG